MNTKNTATQTNENLDNADFNNWADWYAREQGWNLCYCTIAQIGEYISSKVCSI